MNKGANNAFAPWRIKIWGMQHLESLVRVLPLISLLTLAPHSAFADPQCVVPPLISTSATTGPQVGIVRLSQTTQPSETIAAVVLGQTSPSPQNNIAPVLDHVVAAGAHVTDVGVSHGLHTVIARNDGQFVRLYVSADGQAGVAGLMADLSPADLLTMAPGQVTELGTLHGIRGMFVRNGGQFQVFYATPDGERVIPGAMFDAQGKNLTHDQVALIPGAIPTVVIGNAANSAAQAQIPAGSLLKAVEATTYGVTGSPTAPRLWVFIDPLCAWSVRAMGQLRPYVTSGRRAARRHSCLCARPRGPGPQHSCGQGHAEPAAGQPWSQPGAAISLASRPSPVADQRLSANMAAVAAIGLRGTPTFVWRKADGTEGRADGLPNDVDALVASIGR